ncbi:MAG: AhpC/TSA family protein [Oceanicaulis sp. HLUCCA04]|nr:MAG: AhpC/TSA family protein [Oceanicaulis sp. HLUCCA04]
MLTLHAFRRSALAVFACLVLAGLAGGPDARAQADNAFGPSIGSTIPDSPVRLADGSPTELRALAGENGLVVYFNRSLSWCPVCIAQTIEINAARDQFAERGFTVAVLTYDSPETLAQAAQRHALELALVSDEGSAVINAFGVADPVYADPDHRAHGVPYPVAFVISPEGEVLARFLHAQGLGEERGYAVRVSVDDVLAGLDAL